MKEPISKAAKHYDAAEVLIELAVNTSPVDGPDDDARDRQEAIAVAQVHATLALAGEVSALQTGLADIAGSLSMIHDALGSIEGRMGPPGRT